MGIEEFAVLLTMLGYNYNMNDNKTNIFMYLNNNKSFEEMKELIKMHNFYYDYIDDIGIIFIGKENKFNWVKNDEH